MKSASTIRIAFIFFMFITVFHSGIRRAEALPYGFQLGISTKNTVTPGSIVSFGAVIKNTGGQPIVFAPSYELLWAKPGNYRPSIVGGVIPSMSYSLFELGDGLRQPGDWVIPDPIDLRGNFLEQFAGKTIAPGESLPFIIRNFVAPSNELMGSSGIASRIQFTLYRTDTLIAGVNLYRTGKNLFITKRWPYVTFTLGDKESHSTMSFFNANVYDMTAPWNTTPTSPVPEPSTMLLFGTGIAGLVSGARFFKKRKNVMKN